MSPSPAPDNNRGYYFLNRTTDRIPVPLESTLDPDRHAVTESGSE